MPETTDANFEDRLKRHWRYRRVAYGLFVAALFLPGARVDYLRNAAPPLPGWDCLVSGLPFWLSNVFFICSPFYRIRTPKNAKFFLISSVMSLLPVAAVTCLDLLVRVGGRGGFICVGGWIWGLSHLLLTRAFFINVGDSGMICRTCGYDMRASPKQCPECGTPSHREAKGGKQRLAWVSICVVGLVVTVFLLNSYLKRSDFFVQWFNRSNVDIKNIQTHFGPYSPSHAGLESGGSAAIGLYPIQPPREMEVSWTTPDGLSHTQALSVPEVNTYKIHDMYITITFLPDNKLDVSIEDTTDAVEKISTRK